MEQIKLPYGQGDILWPTDKYPEFQLIIPGEVEATGSEEEVIREGLASPFGDKKLAQLRDAEKIVIVTCDNTRAVPNKRLMPILLNELEKAGIASDRVTILIGAGLHPPMPSEKFADLLGEDVVKRVQVYSHDAKDLSQMAYLGESSRKTPIYINKRYVEADARIIVGMIDPHQFIGFSGGAKGLVIGLGGEKLIQANHSMLTNTKCELGNIEDNPARLDIEEIGGKVGIDFIVNVIVNNNKEVVKVVAGDYQLAHKTGVKIAKEVCQVKAKPAHLVVASQGGIPKDVNLYQAQKALKHAAIVAKEGGVIILLAECSEGVGEELFENTMALDSCPSEVIDRFAKTPFKMGAHKAFLWARSLAKAKTILVADGISQEMADLMMVTKVKDLDEALAMAAQWLPEKFKIAIMPKASSTIPMLEDN